ncbi:MAG: hypothetical protein FJ109_11385 [Deltaproteobacteria bacterium]|nr:hypothetical protein [Deltaproteobacteria bacterium]
MQREQEFSQFCPTCRRHYETDRKVCPADGTPLLEIPLSLPRPGNVFDGRYVILEVIGKGGMATIYRGFDIVERRQCALKVLKAKFSGEERAVGQFFNEARVARRLEHPNIIRTYEYGRTTVGYLYIAMELLEGQTLSQLLREKIRLEVGRAIGIFTQVMRALDCAHATGTVHRDLKPENVFLAWQDGREVVKLLDFGIAQFAGLTHLVSRDICGTPAYMAPEQIRGRETGPSADLYSAGIVLFEMLSGSQPFHGESPMDVLRLQLKAQPPCLLEACPGIPLVEPLSALVSRLLRKKPVERYGRAADILAYLNRMTEPGFESSCPSPPGPSVAARPLAVVPPTGPETGDEEISAAIVLASDAQRSEAGFVPESIDGRLTEGRPLVRTDAGGIHRQRYWLADAAGDDPRFRLVGCLDPDRSMDATRSGPAIRLQDQPRIALAPAEQSAALADLASDLVANGHPAPEHEVASAPVPTPNLSGSASNRELCLLHARLVCLGQASDREFDDVRTSLGESLERWFALLDSLGGLVCHDSGTEFKVLFGYSDNGMDFTRSALEAACSLSCLVDEAASVTGRPYAVRIGLASGKVFFDRSTEGPLDWMIRGSSVDLAVRLSRIAPPGGVLACETTVDVARSWAAGHELAGISARGGTHIRTFLVQELAARPETVPSLLDAMCPPMPEARPSAPHVPWVKDPPPHHIGR